ncbi:hypothetical protein A2U01_0072258, partial [Trifolium medium]|nr:hypothetical protein [Trifolium medium]
GRAAEVEDEWYPGDCNQGDDTMLRFREFGEIEQ